MDCFSHTPARLALGLLLAAAVACGGTSPAPQAGPASVQFSVGSASADARLAAAMAYAVGDPPASIVVSIERENGELVHDLLRLDVYSFGATYVSQRLELPVGRYRLTQFLVVGPEGDTLYAAPNGADPGADPALVAAVRRPLPIGFEVAPGVPHSQPVEVLPVGNNTPQQFGYAAFTFRVNAFAKTATRAAYSAGPDGILFDDDDEVTSYNYVEYKENGDVRTDRWFVLPDGRGADGIWFTEDDAPAGWWWDRDTYGTNRSGPGEDGIFVTDDDPITGWEGFPAWVPGTTMNHPLYSSPGDDGAWFTDDDVLSGYYKLDVNADGAETRRVRYVSPGWDGIWFNDDDEPGQDWFGVYVVNRFRAGNVKWGSWDRQVSYSDPGWDGVWFTADDRQSLCRRHEFADGTQYWTREIVSIPGYDETCFTGDDLDVGYTVATNTY